MTMLAETLDAVIGIGTHRDSHEVEIADGTGQPIATMRIGHDSAGFARLRRPGLQARYSDHWIPALLGRIWQA